jgi:hypothetical protein
MRCKIPEVLGMVWQTDGEAQGCNEDSVMLPPLKNAMKICWRKGPDEPG